MGNKLARFWKGQTRIELYAPHMSFEMTLEYLHDSLIRQFETGSQEEKRRNLERDASKL